MKFNRCFEGTYSLHLQGLRNMFNKKLASKQVLASFLLNLFFWPCRWRRYVPPKCRLTFNGLHGVISQKMVLFKISYMFLIYLFCAECPSRFFLLDLSRYWFGTVPSKPWDNNHVYFNYFRSYRNTSATAIANCIIVYGRILTDAKESRPCYVIHKVLWILIFITAIRHKSPLINSIWWFE
jgi:hypothetical protein